MAEGDGEMRKKTRKTVRKRNDQTVSFERRRWLWNLSGFNLLAGVADTLSKCNIWCVFEGDLFLSVLLQMQMQLT